MKTQKGTRHQAEEVLELSNAILAAAIKGLPEAMDELVNRRADLIEQMFSSEESSADNRLFLAGVMEHVRMVDAATREYLDWDRYSGRTMDGELEIPWSGGGPEVPDDGMAGYLRWRRCPAA